MLFWYMGFHNTAPLNGTMSGAQDQGDAKRECWIQVHGHISGFPGQLTHDIVTDDPAMVQSLQSQGYSIVQMKEPEVWTP